MTQSRQGDEPQHPAVRPAHEGVVLPADTSGPRAGEALPAPGGAQPWGRPWGPQSSQAPQPPSHAPQPQGPQTFGQPLPPENSGRDAESTQYMAPMPGGPGNSGSEATQYIAPVPAGTGSEATQYIAPIPGGPGNSGSEATQYLAPVPAGTGSEATQYIAPMPGGPGNSGSEATQYLAPVPVGTGSEATQYIAPVPAGGGDAEATQFIAPVGGPGALPPESAGQAAAFPAAPAPGGADPTQVLPPVPPAPQDAPYGIRPGAPGDRQPPAEFDSLFRADDPQQQGAGTQQLPRFQPSVPLNRPQQQAPAQQFPPPPHSAAGPPFQEGPGQQSGYEPEAPRRKSRAGLIAAVVVGCAVIGLGAGALLSGGDSGSKTSDQQPAGVSSPATGDGGGAKDAGADPAKAQAEALDKVLADSGSSRDAVIGAVAEIRACGKLDQAAAALRGAAKQRGDLVTRLGGLSLDKLPAHDKLSGDLTRAWQSSAAADNHYAAWADAVAGDKGKNCKDGHAKRNKDAGQGDKASGDATKAKQEASGLWNAIATKYSLTKRGATQL
ncbi:hypothetical protein AB0451_29775 [Streptomyces sp. NPDC052000]|uniref:hypothetical protein n=1 Tax=Streptomyces sp. NPDC052000 TaxID=3155676 RepID=UPI00344C3BB7